MNIPALDRLKEFIPKFIREIMKYPAGHVLTAEEFNKHMNLNTIQGDYNAETLVDVINVLVDYDEQIDIFELRITENEIDIANLFDDLAVTKGRVSVNEADIAQLESDMHVAENRLSVNEHDIDLLQLKDISLDEDIAGLDVRAIDLEGRATGLEGRATSLETRVTFSEQDIDRLENRATDVEAHATNNTVAHTALKIRVTNNEADISSLDNRIADNTADIVALDGVTVNNTNDIDDLQGQITANKAQMESKDTSLQDQINILSSGDVNAIIALYDIVVEGTNDYSAVYGVLSYFEGLVVMLRDITPNTGPATFNLNEHGPKPLKIVGLDGELRDPEPGELFDTMMFIYDGTQFRAVDHRSLDTLKLLNTVQNELSSLSSTVSTGDANKLGGQLPAYYAKASDIDALINGSTKAGHATLADSVDWDNVTDKPAASNWASKATNNMVSGMMSWRNYGNNHVIFDASKGVAPNGASIDKNNPATPWSSSYPSLMGWNGDSTYGVRVNSSKSADISSDTSKMLGIPGDYYRGRNYSSTSQDPNLAAYPYILTKHSHCPDSSNYWHIRTQFYSSVSSGANRAQIAIQYQGGVSAYVRSCYGGTWTAWVRIDNNGKVANADKLDGWNSSSFLRADADNTLYKKITAHGSSRSAGMYGHYDSHKIAHIWSMGTSYKIPDNGANFGNLYGLAYKHTNNGTGGTMAGGHQMVWCTNGGPRAALGDSGMWTSGEITAKSNKRVYHKGNQLLQGSVNIPTSSWGNSGYAAYPKRRAIGISGMTANDSISIAPKDNASITRYIDANIGLTQTYNGGFYVFAEKVPSGTVSVDYVIVKGL